MTVNVTPPAQDPWDKGVRASDVPVATSVAPIDQAADESIDPFTEYSDETAPAPAPRVEFADVKEAALRSAESVIQWILPHGKRVGSEWSALNPTRADSKPGSFNVNLRTIVWSDFATGDKGGDAIDLYAYVHGCDNIRAKDALAGFLGVQPGQQRVTSSAPTRTKPAPTVVAVSELNEAPKAFPPRTLPDKDGKPNFIVAGDEGPRAYGSEKRRHFYRKGGVPVRVKIMKKDDSQPFNAYRVTDTDGRTGWQPKKPEGYADIPYTVVGSDPFAAKINQPIFWTEGEKDVDTVARLGGLAFTFGGCGDGLPSGCEQCVVGRNVAILADKDEAGRKHAEAKAALAAPVATSVKVIHFRELEDKQDVSDWAAIEGNNLEALMARVEKAGAWTPSQAAAPQRRSLTTGDFLAFLPEHKYLYIPTRDLWAAVAVNSQLQPIPVLDQYGKQKISPPTKNRKGEDVEGEPEFMTPNVWLDKHQAVEQMTWAPGLPMLIHDQLIAEGGWFDHPGAACFNLYRPPTIKHGDPAKAGRWVDHVKRIYPDDADHIINWLACRVQHPEIKINHSLVLGGKPGAGKDTLLAPVVQAVGKWNCSEVSPDNLFEPFNDYLKAVIMRVSEARDIGDVSKFQLYERMKVMSAAPPETLRVNEKNRPAHHIANIVGAIITTNDKNNSLYLPADDRRHYVAWTDAQHSDFDSQPGAGDAHVYFDGMYRWYETEGGFEDIAAYLATRDLSGFNPKAPPLKTPAFWAIVEAGRQPEESEIADALDRLNNPPAITVDCLMTGADGDLALYLRERKNRKAVSHKIHAAGYEVIRNDTVKDGMWVIKGARKVIYASNSLTVAERHKAATRLAAGDLWCGDQWKTPSQAGKDRVASKLELAKWHREQLERMEKEG